MDKLRGEMAFDMVKRAAEAMRSRGIDTFTKDGFAAMLHEARRLGRAE